MLARAPPWPIQSYSYRLGLATLRHSPSVEIARFWFCAATLRSTASQACRFPAMQAASSWSRAESSAGVSHALRPRTAKIRYRFIGVSFSVYSYLKVAQIDAADRVSTLRNDEIESSFRGLMEVGQSGCGYLLIDHVRFGCRPITLSSRPSQQDETFFSDNLWASAPRRA